MRKFTFWRFLTALLTVACLLTPLPAGASEAQAGPRAEAGEFTQEELVWLALPGAREDRLPRYAAWAAKHPKLEAAQVVLQVNLDQDRAPYDNPRTVEDPDSLEVLVNKHNALPASYIPELEALGSKYGSGSLRPEAAQAFRAMADAARADGITLRSVSAYRSYSYQKTLYNRYLTQYRQATVDTFSARAGFSEHQTGLALDINVARSSAHFERTPAYAWLQAHCAEYGFILRYGQDKESVTGYRFEPWHYRYVGEEIARVCMEQGIAYEEYLALGLTPPAAEEPETVSETEAVSQPETADLPPTEPVSILPFPLGEGTPIEL